MNVIGISGLSNSVPFKRARFPGLSAREYNIAQGFDAAAALVGSHGVIAAAAEERFTHQKATGTFPVNALRYCLAAGGLAPRDVDVVAHGFDYAPVRSLFEADEAAQREYEEVFSPETQRALLRTHFPEAGWSDKFVPVPHHLAHAASAFFLSGFPEALILISDGMGEVQSVTVAVGSGSDIRVLKEISAFHSLGMLYGVFTLYLGFYMNSDEYKVMGLAPYGNPRRFFNQLMEFVSLKPDGTYTVPLFARNRTALERETHRGVLQFLVEQFGPAREPESEITQFHQDLAAGLQAVLQTCQMHVLEHFARETGQKHLCLAGGVALNCSANGMIKRSGRFEQVFVQPAAGDDGTALGAALYAQRLHDSGFKPHRMRVPLWGPEFSDQEIRRVLADREDCFTVEMESFDVLCEEVAARLAQGQIVAWFQGRMEFGPRALGSRSILADPRDPTMRDRINSLVKKREEFRPFAPVVAKEAAAQIFEITPGEEETYAHMLYVTPVRPEYRAKLPATTHVDGSARIQTVGREDNPRLWQLLNTFAARSGMPVLLNTSFNVRGQPIVCTPEEAIDTFLTAGLDVLVAGNTLVLPQRRPAEARLQPEPVDQAATEEAGRARSPQRAARLLETPAIPALCVHQFFEEQAHKTPEAVAAVCEAEQLTYAELDRRANQLAHHLRKLKVGPEVLVGICMDVSLEMLVSLLGVLKAGGAYVPLDPTYPKERLGFMIRDARLPVLLTQQRLSALLPEAIAQASAAQPGEARSPELVLDATVVCVDTEWEAIEKESAGAVASGVTPENLAYVIYTSGSTGKPKGVMVTHRNVANFFVGMDARIGTEPPGVWLAVTSISFDISVLELFWPLARGFKVVLQRKEERFSRSVPVRAESARRSMDFSLFYFASDQGAGEGQKYRLLLEGAKFADEHDFAAVWTPERHFHAFGGLYPNPSVTSAAVAVLTRRVQIRAGSVVLPLHHPLRVAEEWAVVDNLSGGRVGLSFASGWQVNDFVLAPERYAQRKELTLRQIELVRRLWRGETVAFPGANGQELPVSILPRPIQRELPFWLTASGHPETFKLAGQLGANLLTHMLGQTPAQLAENLAAYHAAWARSGHPGKGYVTLMLHTFVGGDLHTVRELVREPFTAYLRSSIDLIKNTPWAFPTFKPPVAALAGGGNSGFTPEEVEFMVRHGFDRYFETSGFFGTPQTCLARVEQLRELGVDEIACLLDFGVETEAVLAGLELLNEVRVQSQQQSARPRPDYSLAAQVARHGVTHLQCTPSLAAMLAEEPQALAALRSLKTLMLGGEALPADLVQRLDLPGRLLNMYGPTETTIWSTTQTVEKAPQSVPIGRPIANTEAYLVDEHLQPVPEGTPGELLIGGAGVTRGYLNRPELTAEKFIPHPFHPGSGARLYRTGDLARSALDGRLEFLGRIDQQVKLRGFRVELGEIEAALRQHPGVKDCAVAVSEVAPGDKRLFAYFVAAPGPLPALAELREFLEEKLPDFMVPAAFIPLAGLPLTPNGKLDRKGLPAPQGVANLSRSFVSPASEVEQKVAAVWREVLGIAQVGLTDNFFELGGNSILATQLVSRLRRVFPGELPLELAFEFPTLQALAAHLASAPPPAAAPQESIGRRANLEEWPLSFAQRRMWFLDQLEPGPHYNEHFHLRLTGPLNLPVLQNALNEILRRHESLRATFSRVEGRPVQRPMAQLTLPLPVTDLSAVPESERQAQAVALAVTDTRKLFDLETGPLLRASLLRLSSEEHILALTFHHIIVDGWSRGVFLRELSALYEALLAGRPSPLAKLPIQYADFATWQQDWLRGPVMDQHLAYWKQQLRTAPPLLDLPADRLRPPVQTYRGARLPVELDKATVEALIAFGHQHGCTLYMVLLAAFQALLARYTGAEDIVVGSPVAQRNRPEIEGLIGYFLNSLVLRTDLSGSPSFAELLARVRKVALDAYAHQDFPFEKLVAELQPERALGFSPVFQVMFILQTAAISPEPVAGVRFSAFEIDSGVSKVDLTLSLEETPHGCTGWVEYATDLFDRPTVERFFSHFRTLLAAVLAEPATPLAQLSVPGVPAPRRTPPDRFSLDGQPRPGDAGRPALESPGRSSAPLLETHAPPRSQVEKELARIWGEVLQVDKVGLHDTMFDLGGHSLLITMITARIRTVFQTDISIRAFFETPTLEAIAALIETNLGRRGVRPPQTAMAARS